MKQENSRKPVAIRPDSGEARGKQSEARTRAIVERVTPEVDAGRFPIKRVLGESVVVEADVFTDGHDAVRCLLLHRYQPAGHGSSNDRGHGWIETEMQPLVNDRWSASFTVDTLGRYEYTVIAWTDRFLTWRRELERRTDPADILIALQIGAGLLEEAAHRASMTDAVVLRQFASQLTSSDAVAGRDTALNKELGALASRYADRRFETRYERQLGVVVDPLLARFGAWYEFFPRSTVLQPGEPAVARHGTFRDCEARLPYVAEMGFDIVYFPPIHPIGRARRKGPNNGLLAGPEDTGSPWAIGATEGGHRAIHPELGTLEDFKRLLHKARELRIEVALDIAFQCAPDHPYVQEHPEWFRVRPDGTVQYAENPPKKYQDIYPFDFETDDWPALYRELTDVVLYWAEQGVRVFRVDNPHTKPYSLWQQLIAEVKTHHPEAIFLSEAFTRPKVMHRLAKLGFTQSYTYFAWRNTQYELREYFTELTQKAGREYFRPNVWPNTPDILPEYLQHGGRAAFMARITLAATLSAAYGIYGPAFELMEHEPRDPGSEEYLNSEKYQLRQWDLQRSDSLAPFIQRLNRIRREHPALQSDWRLQFLPIDNEQLIAYAKTTPDYKDIIVTVVNLDPHHAHSGWVEVPLAQWGVDAERAYRMADLLGGGSYLWQGARNFVRLDPQGVMAHVFSLHASVRTERQFDYFQ